MMTSVQEVMTKNLQTVPLGASASEALELMTEKRIRHLPVVDSRRHIVGILSQEDISSASAPKATPVEAIMRRPLDFVEERLPLRSAVLHMLEQKISCLLVVNENKEVIGLVTTDDLLWHLAHLLSHESEDQPILGASERLTIGEIANELSLMGI